jgi:cell wall-associated NlpC family hydrolase
VTVDGRVATRFYTAVARPIIAHDDHVGPNTGFQKTIAVTPATHTQCVMVGNLGPGAMITLRCVQMTNTGALVQPAPDRNALIATAAKKYVGDRYVEGGATPARGFDCSGLVQYVYKTSVNISLPHNAQAQYNGAHKITAAQARQGDLVFFHSGSGAVYHVGIYAAPHVMWAAATPRDGVRFQSIWSSAVTYGSYTH